MLDFKQNYFALFGLPFSTNIEPVALNKAYQNLQQQYHPDAHATAAAEIQAQVLLAATHINTAYATLKDDVARFNYILELLENPADGAKSQQASDGAFLMKTLDWYEQLDAIDAQAADAQNKSEQLATLQQELEDEYKQLYSAITAAFEAEQHQQMIVEVRSIMQLKKIQQRLIAKQLDLAEEMQ